MNLGSLGAAQAFKSGGLGRLVMGNSGDPLNGKSASDTYAQLVRDQWADYKNTFAPYEQQLINLSTGNADNLQSEQRVTGAVNNSFATSLGTLSRDRQRLGLNVGADQAADESRLASVQKTGSLVNAANQARLHAQDRDTAVLTGGLSSIRTGAQK